ncbi:MAG: enoyl-CoA hydratase/isomerase family protein [Desulfobacterales bacterium]|nr:enoyl-CoA hydratase/isomerase family protein [Desulfobacterales bacterium]
MEFIQVEINEGLAVITLARGKVNALNNTVVNELRGALKTLEADSTVNSVILTGQGGFFSFGFDVPEFFSFEREAFAAYLTNFTDLYTYLFLYPKPVVAALNGHTIAGGCMLALACDTRVMVKGKARISLNEITFGSSVFAGSTEMLRFLTGSANAAEILYSGAMYSAGEAVDLGLVEQALAGDELMAGARETALALGAKYPPAFAGIKSLLRRPVAEEMRKGEKRSIREFVDIWYSEPTRANLREIKIR